VGGAYIIMAAFIVRSLPASVRSGIAALQQIEAMTLSDRIVVMNMGITRVWYSLTGWISKKA
jgi:hypothetical protein